MNLICRWWSLIDLSSKRIRYQSFVSGFVIDILFYVIVFCLVKYAEFNSQMVDTRRSSSKRIPYQIQYQIFVVDILFDVVEVY